MNTLTTIGRSVLSILALLGLTWQLNCGGGVVNTRLPNDFSLAAVVVSDANTNQTVDLAHLSQNGAYLTDGKIFYGSDTLIYSDTLYGADSLYAATFSTAARYAPGGYLLKVSHGTQLDRSFSSTMIGPTTITNVVPTNHLLQGNGQVSMEWLGVSNVEAWVMAAVKADSAYTGRGYSEFSTTANNGTIPPDAFLSADGFTPDTGLYNLYVYGVTGAPDTSLANRVLPVPLPDQLPDNISQREIAGHFGVVVVALYDTIRVVQQF
jgi:hypothetical protein